MITICMFIYRMCDPEGFKNREDFRFIYIFGGMGDAALFVYWLLYHFGCPFC